MEAMAIRAMKTAVVATLMARRSEWPIGGAATGRTQTEKGPHATKAQMSAIKDFCVFGDYVQ